METKQVDVQAIQSRVAKALRLEKGDRNGQWWVPAEPGPLGPFDIVEAAEKFVKLIDLEDEKNRAALSDAEGIVREMAHFGRHKGDCEVTESGEASWSKCTCGLGELLNRPSVQQLLHEGR